MNYYARRRGPPEMHVVVAAVAVLLLVAFVPGQDAYPDGEVMMADVVEEVLEQGSSCHFPITSPMVPESPEQRREHYRVMEAKDEARHRKMAELGLGTARRRQVLTMPPAAKLMSTSESEMEMTELMASTSTFELPMRSALTILDVGMYLVTVRIGTPALPYNMALDTVNDLSWLNCRLRGHRRHRDRKKKVPVPVPVLPAPEKKTNTTTTTIMSLADASDPVNVSPEKVKYVKNWYRPARSKSWRRYRCSQAESCGRFPNVRCKTNNRNESCPYVLIYEDGTTTRGIFGSETATVAVSGGRMARLPGLVLGCSTHEAGGTVAMHDGVLTLGNQDVSFGTVAGGHFEGRFSFCLLSTRSTGNASSYLTFGPNPAMDSVGVCQTPLLYTQGSAFGVHVTGIFVNGKRLDIPPEVWNPDTGGGLYIDTGTSITGFAEPTYSAVIRAITPHLEHLKKEKIHGFDHCYWWTFTGDGVDPANNVTIPSFEMEFLGGGRLNPGASGVVVPEVAPGVVCLAFRRRGMGRPSNIMGNVQMQEHIWEVDHFNSVIRFKKDKCLNHHNLPPPPTTTHSSPTHPTPTPAAAAAKH